MIDQLLHDLEKIEAREVLPGFLGKFIHTETMTYAYWTIKKNAVLPRHSHHNEQITNLIKGKFELTIGSKTILCTPGQIVTIPANVEHGGTALEESIIVDIFSPKRDI